MLCCALKVAEYQRRTAVTSILVHLQTNIVKKCHTAIHNSRGSVNISVNSVFKLLQKGAMS